MNGGGGGTGVTYLLKDIISMFTGIARFCRKFQLYFGRYPVLGSAWCELQNNFTPNETVLIYWQQIIVLTYIISVT